jgi:hypothetical protein
MRSAESLAAEALVLDDLKAVQVFVRRVFALGTRTEILDRAIPVLVRRLGQDDPDDVLFDIGCVLCTMRTVALSERWPQERQRLDHAVVYRSWCNGLLSVRLHEAAWRSIRCCHRGG